MGTTIDAGEQHCSDTRDAPGDHSVFLCNLGGLGVWMSFLAAAGNMSSCSSVCNLISFRSSRERCSVFAGLSIGLMWPNAAHAAGPGCALLEPVAGSSPHPCPRSESARSTRSSFAFELCSNKVRSFQLVTAHKRLCC